MPSLRRGILVLSTSSVVLTSACATDGTGSAAGTDLDWLWGLLVVIALFVLGGIAYKLRNPRKGLDHDAPHAPEGRIMVQRGKGSLKRSGPYDYGPRVPDDPSNVPKFYHQWDGS